MAKERTEKAQVEDVVAENRALFGNALATIAVIFLAWISYSVTELAASSKVQERELVNMNKYFTVVLEIQQRQIDGHVNNADIHVYNANIQSGLKP